MASLLGYGFRSGGLTQRHLPVQHLCPRYNKYVNYSKPSQCQLAYEAAGHRTAQAQASSAQDYALSVLTNY